MNDDSTAPRALPLVKPLATQLSPTAAFSRLAHLPHLLFLDSSSHEESQGRYSFLAVDPFQWLTCNADEPDAWDKLVRIQQQFHTSTCPDLPPFQGGSAGLWGYDLSRCLEDIPAASITDFPIPAMAIGFYDVVVAFDHATEQSWIISQGFPETEVQARQDRAQARLAQMQSWLTSEPAAQAPPPRPSKRLEELAPQYDIGLEGVTSNLTARSYRKMIDKAVEYIHAGDIFQVNLAQRLLCPARSCSQELYLKLRQSNPAPYSGFFDLGNWQICSTSPECFITHRAGQVETRPIKGTRGRHGSAEADLFVGDELQLSEKDRAENVMIVDLLRNDLSQVCLPDSVQVTQLFQLEKYAFVKHLVSTVQGRLRPEASPYDLLKACFPGGSITGAPKIRAQEIIAELEPTARGAYCGSLGYLGFDGQMDSNILIRTITAGAGWWQLPVGGGIVAQSNPEDEYRETWHKARGMLKAVEPQRSS